MFTWQKVIRHVQAIKSEKIIILRIHGPVKYLKNLHLTDQHTDKLMDISTKPFINPTELFGMVY